MQCKGISKGNIIILENGVILPHGIHVVVTVDPMEDNNDIVSEEEIEKRRTLTARMKEFGQKLADRDISLSELVLEEREELENRA